MIDSERLKVLVRIRPPSTTCCPTKKQKSNPSVNRSTEYTNRSSTAHRSAKSSNSVDNDQYNCVKAIDEHSLAFKKLDSFIGGEVHFTFDQVYPESSTQEDLYEGSIRDTVEAAITGKNVTILTMGAMRSGKSYTMIGSKSSGSNKSKLNSNGSKSNLLAPSNKSTTAAAASNREAVAAAAAVAASAAAADDDDISTVGATDDYLEAPMAVAAGDGIIPRSISTVYHSMQQESSIHTEVDFYVELSFIELYKNIFRDLLEDYKRTRITNDHHSQLLNKFSSAAMGNNHNHNHSSNGSRASSPGNINSRGSMFHIGPATAAAGNTLAAAAALAAQETDPHSIYNGKEWGYLSLHLCNTQTPLRTRSATADTSSGNSHDQRSHTTSTAAAAAAATEITKATTTATTSLTAVSSSRSHNNLSSSRSVGNQVSPPSNGKSKASSPNAQLRDARLVTDLIDVHESEDFGVFLSRPGGNIRVPASTAEEALEYLAAGCRARTTRVVEPDGHHSSRGHAIFTIYIEKRIMQHRARCDRKQQAAVAELENCSSNSSSNADMRSLMDMVDTRVADDEEDDDENDDEEEGEVVCTDLYLGKLHFVDLAGTEKFDNSAAAVRGDALKEHQFINSSLNSFGEVLRTLSKNARITALHKQQQQPQQHEEHQLKPQQQQSLKGKLQHVPFLNSKLAHMLKYSLGGNFSTIIIAAVQNDAQYASLTSTVLQYAAWAKNIRCSSAVVRFDINQLRISAAADAQDESARLRNMLSARSETLVRHRSGRFKVPLDPPPLPVRTLFTVATTTTTTAAATNNRATGTASRATNATATINSGNCAGTLISSSLDVFGIVSGATSDESVASELDAVSTISSIHRVSPSDNAYSQSDHRCIGNGSSSSQGYISQQQHQHIITAGTRVYADDYDMNVIDELETGKRCYDYSSKHAACKPLHHQHQQQQQQQQKQQQQQQPTADAKIRQHVIALPHSYSRYSSIVAGRIFAAGMSASPVSVCLSPHFRAFTFQYCSTSNRCSITASQTNVTTAIIGSISPPQIRSISDNRSGSNGLSSLFGLPTLPSPIPRLLNGNAGVLNCS